MPDEQPDVAPLAEELTHGPLPDEARALHEADAAPNDPPPPEWRNWLYTGHERIYSNVPVTVTTGDIVTWHSDPGMGDGCWTATTADANKHPDNYREEEPASAAQTPEEG